MARDGNYLVGDRQVRAGRAHSRAGAGGVHRNARTAAQGHLKDFEVLGRGRGRPRRQEEGRNVVPRLDPGEGRPRRAAACPARARGDAAVRRVIGRQGGVGRDGGDRRREESVRCAAGLGGCAHVSGPPKGGGGVVPASDPRPREAPWQPAPRHLGVGLRVSADAVGLRLLAGRRGMHDVPLRGEASGGRALVPPGHRRRRPIMGWHLCGDAARLGPADLEGVVAALAHSLWGEGWVVAGGERGYADI
mmetsp:Transcript_80366/g.233337  ORF Transcript_80366/g.233337 Transcript_80366/m.233337 type:complete len:248 (+) Transcript_80366:2536-3279(+)